jgi:glucosyl-dolichyl phosphate glucuronosyltransferase
MQRDEMFSIVIPTFNRAEASSLTVESVLSQDASVPYEVIVVDNGSTDDTRARVQRLADQTAGRVHYRFEKDLGLSRARNAGVAAARGSIIAFVDDDAIAHPGWLEALAETYRAYPDAWCVGGKIVLRLPAVLPPWFDPHSVTMMAYLSGLDLGEATLQRQYPNDVWGANFSVRRAAVTRVGPFDTALGPLGRCPMLGDETELCWRIQAAGGGVYYCGAAVVTHVIPEARLTKRSLRKRAYWTGRTWGLLDRKDLVAVRLRQLPRLAASGIKNWIESSRHAGTVQSRQAFQRELRAWFGVGFLHQRFVMTVTRHPGLRRSATPGATLRGLVSRAGR